MLPFLYLLFFPFLVFIYFILFTFPRYLHLLALTTKIHLAFIIFYGGGIIADGLASMYFLIVTFLFVCLFFYLFFKEEWWTRIALGYTVIITNNIIYGKISSSLSQLNAYRNVQRAC
jgi:hypothetical protein